jgi:hypothetical protein
MENHKKPTLIRFSWGEQTDNARYFDAKRWLILILMVVYTAFFSYLLTRQVPIHISATGDRSTLWRILENRTIANDYRVNIENRNFSEGLFVVKCSYSDNNPHDCAVVAEKNPFPLKPRENITFNMTVTAQGKQFEYGRPNKMLLLVEDQLNPNIKAQAEIVFFMPEKSDLDKPTQGTNP